MKCGVSEKRLVASEGTGARADQSVGWGSAFTMQFGTAPEHAVGAI